MRLVALLPGHAETQVGGIYRDGAHKDRVRNCNRCGYPVIQRPGKECRLCGDCKHVTRDLQEQWGGYEEEVCDSGDGTSGPGSSCCWSHVPHQAFGAVYRLG